MVSEVLTAAVLFGWGRFVGPPSRGRTLNARALVTAITNFEPGLQAAGSSRSAQRSGSGCRLS